MNQHSPLSNWASRLKQLRLQIKEATALLTLPSDSCELWARLANTHSQLREFVGAHWWKLAVKKLHGDVFQRETHFFRTSRRFISFVMESYTIGGSFRLKFTTTRVLSPNTSLGGT